MKAACLLIASMYFLASSANGGIGTGGGAFGFGFDAAGESVGGDGTIGAKFVGSGGVSVVSIGTES